MKKLRSFPTLGAAAVTVALVLSGCGGGGPPSVAEQVPGSASESSASFMSYLKELVASAADTREPVSTDMVSPPADDRSEPSAVD